MMTAPKYHFESLVEEIEVFVLSNRDPLLKKAWEYTKRIVQAHSDTPEKAWRDFDNTLTEEEVHPALQGAILNLLSHIPEHRFKGFHRAIDVGRARARGLDREEALNWHLNDLVGTPTLRLIEGGKNN